MTGTAGKTALALLCVLFLAVSTAAAENGQGKQKYPVKEEHGADLYMLNYSKYIQHGFYLSVIGQAAQYNKGWGALIGGRAALLVDHIFAIGGGYELSIETRRSDIHGRDSSTERLMSLTKSYDARIRTVYGGGYIAYHIFSDKIVNFSMGALGGAGRLGKEYGYGPGSTFFFVEPELFVYVNLPHYARIGIGTSYRISWGIDYQGISDRDFRGFSIGLQVQCGIL